MKTKLIWFTAASILPFLCVGMLAASPEEPSSAEKDKAEIAELKQQLKMVLERLEQLEKRVQNNSPPAPVVVASDPAQGSPCVKTIAALSSQTPPCETVVEGPCAKPVVATICPPEKLVVLQDGREGVSLTELVTHTKSNLLRLYITGQLNRAAWLPSNGHKENLQFVDNDSSSSRIAFIAEGDFNKDLTVGAVIMEEILQNSTRDTTINGASTKDAAFTTRKAEVYAVSKTAGEFYLGRGYMASYQSMNDTDFSSTTATMDGEKISEVASAVAFYDKTTHAVSSGLTGSADALVVGKVFESCDGLGRRDRFRYNSPKIKDFSLQSSYAYDFDSYMWDVGLRYGAEWGKTQVGGSWFFERNNVVKLVPTEKVAYNQVNGSMGALFPNGISVMIAGAYRNWKDISAPAAHSWFGKLGYQHEFFAVGKTAFAVDYGQYRNFFIDTTQGLSSQWIHRKGQTVGVGAVQFFDKVNTEVYFMWRGYKLSASHSDNYDPINVFLLGARVSF